MRPVEKSASRRVSTSRIIGLRELAEPSKLVTEQHRWRSPYDSYVIAVKAIGSAQAAILVDRAKRPLRLVSSIRAVPVYLRSPS